MSKLTIYLSIIYNLILFHLKGIRFGKRLRVFNRLYLNINPKAKLIIGDDLLFTSGGGHNPLCRNIRGYIYLPYDDSECIIGDSVGISSCCIWASKSIRIGNRVKIGGNCTIMDTDVHSLDYRIRMNGDKNNQGNALEVLSSIRKSIIIEDDVFIGTGCTILKGVTIGARSIIAAGSVITKSIPADTIAGGNPCRVIKRINND